MAKSRIIAACLALWLATGGEAGAEPAASATAAASGARAVPMAARLPVPRLAGRITAAQLGLVVNDADPYSVEVGRYYARRRGIAAARVLHVNLPLGERLEEAAFQGLKDAVQRHFGPEVQALALAWTRPWAVGCQGLTGALTLGLQPGLCAHSCAPSNASRYFNAATTRPWKDLGLRPAMQLAAPDVAAARALIDRGVAADFTLGRRGAPPVAARLLTTGDAARNVRARLYPQEQDTPLYTRLGVLPQVLPATEPPPAGRGAVLLQVGLATLEAVPPTPLVPGALADHLTSRGGMLTSPQGQASALEWLARGATASHGAASEPCNHLQKFPHPQVLLLHYAQGASAIEAYWKSVQWPAQSVFIGEPLAAPFAVPAPRR